MTHRFVFIRSFVGSFAFGVGVLSTFLASGTVFAASTQKTSTIQGEIPTAAKIPPPVPPVPAVNTSSPSKPAPLTPEEKEKAEKKKQAQRRVEKAKASTTCSTCPPPGGFAEDQTTLLPLEPTNKNGKQNGPATAHPAPPLPKPLIEPSSVPPTQSLDPGEELLDPVTGTATGTAPRTQPQTSTQTEAHSPQPPPPAPQPHVQVQSSAPTTESRPALAPVTEIPWPPMQRRSAPSAAPPSLPPAAPTSPQTYSVPAPDVAPSDAIRSVERGEEVGPAMASKPCATCGAYSTGNADQRMQMRERFEAKTSQDQGVLVEAKNGENKFGVRSEVCGSPKGYTTCILDGSVTPEKFGFVNMGSQLKDGAPVDGKSREWSFQYEGKVRQDLGFMVTDTNASGSTSETFMMVFPRKYLPNIRIEGGKQIVTLPTGETVTYDAKTRAITGGVLTEKPRGQGPGSVSYSGNGLSIRADGRHEPRQGKGAKSTATVSKGGKSCQVPLKSLWPDQSENSAFHFKFTTDEELNQFLKSRPGCPTIF